MKRSTGMIVKIGLLSAIAFVLMYLEFSVPFFPSWLKFDVSDVPALLGTFAIGPLAGAIIELLKNILHIVLKGTTTGAVGELANFFLGAAFVVPAGWVYMRNKTKKGAVIGLIIGIIGLMVLGSIANYYIFIPAFAKIMPLEQIFKVASMANKYIVDTKTYILYAVIPFNLVKGVIEALITFLLYKRLSNLLHK
ncbi:MAG: ECF transporter S component [Clostridia bacterium]